MTRDELQSTLQQPYQRDRWGQILRGVLSGTELFNVAQPVATTNTQARQIHQLGRIRLAGGRNLAALEITLHPTVDLLRNRVGLRNLVARFIDQAEYHGVLAVFLTAHPAYRFTFAASESVFDDAGHVTRVETAPRRYTYILGPGEACRTPAERFAHLTTKGTAAELNDVIEAFSVDKLNKEFFADFCRAFEHVTNDIQRRHRLWPAAIVEREAQTLLDRLLFLYFVQRKGWLNRQRDYLAGHFREHYEAHPKGTTYLDQFLRPLFVKLSTEGPVADIAGHDLPFLNGGLFNDEYGDEQNDEGARRHKDLTVGNDTLHSVFENLLERYNFTIHEDSPSNQEVAIDPEMLGRIFESLVLQIEQSGTGGKSLRHDTGSIYTPRPIVHYQCREALAAWLESQPPFACPSPAGAGEGGAPAPGEGRESRSPARQRIDALLRLDASDGIDDAERKTLAESLTPEEAARLLDRIFDLRACDPAVGSGAFAMGLLRELVNLARLGEARARGRDPIEGDRAWLYETKKRLIERVIYGVDIQERAVEICKLRLWLSLMVDHDLGVEPADCEARAFRKALKALEPLPNLDFKIRRANSLVDHIHGEPVELSALSRETGVVVPLSKLGSAKRDFFNAHTAAAKRRLRLDIYEALTDIAKIELTRARTDAAGIGLALDEEATRRVVELDRGLKEIAFITAQVHDARKLRAAQQDAALERIRAEFDDSEKPTFVWHLDFAEVFHCQPPAPATGGGQLQPAPGLSLDSQPPAPSQLGGFDIILANPPYVRHELLGRDFKETRLRPAYPEVYSGTTDLYVYFYARAHQLLRPGGIGAFISSNKWLRVEYGEKLRQLLLDAQEFRLVVDFGELPVFEAAATFPAIFLWRKHPRGHSRTAWACVRDLKTCYAEGIAAHVARIVEHVPASRFGKGKPRLADLTTATRRAKMNGSGPSLAEYVRNQIFFGIKTGLNAAFVIDNSTRDSLIRDDPACEQIIKPVISGDDVRRYEIHPKQEYLIYVPWDTNIGAYRSVAAHLAAYKDPLLNRPEARQKRHPWYALTRYASDYAHLFDRPKIHVPAFAMRARFAMDRGEYFLLAPAYFVSSDDPYLLAVLNSTPAFNLLLEICSVLGDQEAKGRAVLRPVYFQKLPIPDAKTADRSAVESLARAAQNLHTQRRSRVEQFLHSAGLPPEKSTSRNPLEQPWALTPEEFSRRAPRPDQKQFAAARDETAALTAQIERVEREIDARVAALYGL